MMPPHGAWVIEASIIIHETTHLRQEIAFTTMTHVNNLAGCEGDSQYRQRILVTGGAGFMYVIRFVFMSSCSMSVQNMSVRVCS